MSSACRAWLLDLGQGQLAAVGHQHMIQFATATQVFEIPLAPRYCVGVMLWRQNIVPIIDINKLIGGTHSSAPEQMRVGIMAYQTAPGEPLRYGGLLLQGEPRQVAVSDDMARPLPGHPAGWRSVSLSCFSLEGRAVPILHVTKVFEESFHHEAAAETFAAEQSGDRRSPETRLVTDPASLTTVAAEAAELSIQGNTAARDPAAVRAGSDATVQAGSRAAGRAMQSEMSRSASEPPRSVARSSDAPSEQKPGEEPVTTESIGQPEPGLDPFEPGPEPVVPSGASADRPDETAATSDENAGFADFAVGGGGVDEQPVDAAGGSEEQAGTPPATDESSEAVDTEWPNWLLDRRERAEGS